jgi:N-acetylmuramoyl-L-alanine amidase
MRTTRLKLILCGVILLTSSYAFSESANYLKVKALPGDGIYTLLRRYLLDQYTCNYDQFYKLNKLNKDALLQLNREYTIPVLIYAYNGQTIRSSVGIADWERALRIQEYNEQMQVLGYTQGSYKNSKVLWVPYHVIHCPEARLVVRAPDLPNPEAPEHAGGARIFPIFGKAFEYVPLESSRLRGQVYYLVSGHGGPDPGAMATRGGKHLCEDEYAYDVTLRLGRKLIAHGATTYIITRDDNDGIRNDEHLPCDTDETVWGNQAIPRGQKERLAQRTDVVNNLFEKHSKQGINKQYLIEVHVDSRSHSQRLDVFFYHYSGSPEGKKLAQDLHQTLAQQYRQYRKSNTYTGTVSARDLFTLREAKPISVYIELANIRNATDQQRIVLPRNRELLAEWLLEGLLK